MDCLHFFLYCESICITFVRVRRTGSPFSRFNRAPISPATNNQRMEVVSLPLMVPVNKASRPFPRGPRPLLTLLLLTAIAGGIEADFGCSKMVDVKNNDTLFFLSDVECRVSEINAAFNGRLKHCQQAAVGQAAYQVSTVACAQHSCKISPPLLPPSPAHRDCSCIFFSLFLWGSFS